MFSAPKATEEKKSPPLSRLEQDYAVYIKKKYTNEKLKECRATFQTYLNDPNKIKANLHSGFSFVDKWVNKGLSSLGLHVNHTRAQRICDEIDKFELLKEAQPNKTEAYIVFEILMELKKIYESMLEEKITTGEVIEGLQNTFKMFEMNLSNPHKQKKIGSLLLLR